MTYTLSQNYTNMVVGEHGIQTFKDVVVVLLVLLVLLLSFDVFVPKSTHPLLILDKWGVQIYFNVNLVYSTKVEMSLGHFTLGVKVVKSWGQLNQNLSAFEA